MRRGLAGEEADATQPDLVLYGASCTQLPCSLVVVGVGVKPEVELFNGQLPVADNGGIQVDGNLRPCAPVLVHKPSESMSTN